jgi:hypothetical protein
VALEDKRIEADVRLDEPVAAAIASRLGDGRLACAAACELAAALSVTPIEVGKTADRMQVRLTACQLGLFGYPGHAKAWEAAGWADPAPPDGLANALLAAGGDRGEMSCARLWHEAERFSATRVAAGWLADRLGIKVRDCHLGTF